MEEKKIFAKGYSFYKIFMIFLIGCFIGTIYEEILNYVRSGIWETRAGVIYGPFNPVYGFGFACFVIFLGKNNDKHSYLKTFIYAALLGGIMEYLVSYLAEMVFNTSSWNYDHELLNIGGRTTVPFMIFWGLGGMVFMKICYPFLSRMFEKIPYRFGNIMIVILIVLMAVNIALSFYAVYRQSERRQGMEPSNIFEKLCDIVYPDEFLKKVFPNMNLEDY